MHITSIFLLVTSFCGVDISPVYGHKYQSIFDAHLPKDDFEGMQFGARPLRLEEEDATFAVHDAYNVPIEMEGFDGHFEDFDEDLEVKDPNCPEPPEDILDDVRLASTRLIDMAPPYRLQNYKNHCWYQCMESTDIYQHNPYLNNMYTKHLAIVREKLLPWRLSHQQYWMLHCLPYFYVIGGVRSGTSDMLAKVSLHPDVIAPPRRDPLWWNVIRYQEMDNSPNEMHSFAHYIQLYDFESEEIRRSFDKAEEQTVPFHRKIIGELSPSLMWYNYIWRRAPENEGREEPEMLNPNYMRQVHPGAKFLIMLRDPIERLYSSFQYFSNEGSDRSAGEFHRVVTNAIHIIQECMDARGIRNCLYDAELTQGQGDPGVRLGMYAQYLVDWYEAYPAEQIHLVRYGRYRDDPKGVLEDVFRYLDLDVPDEEAMNVITSMPWVMGNHAYKTEAEPMLQETREVLYEFYRPYNEHLAYMMGDDSYLWHL